MKCSDQLPRGEMRSVLSFANDGVRMIRFLFFGALILSALFSVPVKAYEANTTHATLSGIAIDRSKLATDSSLLSRLGLKAYGQNQIAIAGLSGASTLKQLFQYGAVEEDNIGLGGARVIYHFYDPQNARGLSVVGKEFETSPNWALEDNGEVDPALYEQQNYSYRDARQFFLSSLTSTQKSDRTYFFGLTMRALGQVAHHVQDMAQPQHVRNEIHCSSRAICHWILDHVYFPTTFYNPSAYETYVSEQNDRILSGDISTTDYPIQSVGVSSQFLEPRDFWVNPHIPGGGMSEFVSSNFPTTSTMIRWNPQQGIFAPDPEFPLPNGSGLTYAFSQCTKGGNIEVVSGICGKLISTIFDPLSGQSKQQEIGDISIIWQPVSAYLLANSIGDQFVSGLFTLGNDIFEAEFETLAPRIVAFTTGLIDYFFRGKPELEFNGWAWRIKNAGSEVLEGTFSLYSEDSYAQRTKVLNNGWDNRVLSLQPGAVSDDIVFGLPSNNSGTYALVFEGRIGKEGQAGENSLTGVAGQVKTLPEIQITWGDNGPLLDDVFRLRVTDVNNEAPNYSYVLDPGTPQRPQTVDLTLPPGQYNVEVIFVNDPVANDFSTDTNGGTYSISFSPNVVVEPGSDPLTGILGAYSDDIALIVIDIPDTQ